MHYKIDCHVNSEMHVRSPQTIGRFLFGYCGASRIAVTAKSSKVSRKLRTLRRLARWFQRLASGWKFCVITRLTVSLSVRKLDRRSARLRNSDCHCAPTNPAATAAFCHVSISSANHTTALPSGSSLVPFGNLPSAIFAYRDARLHPVAARMAGLRITCLTIIVFP